MSDIAGKSVLDLLWEKLDEFMDALMAPAHQEGPAELAELKGRAYGMAEAIGVITNPYHSDLDAVRAEAVERWEERNRVVPMPNERTDTGDDGTTRVRWSERRARRQARRAVRNG